MSETPGANRFRELLKHTRDIFLAGIIVAVPLVVTYLVFSLVVQTLDGIFQPVIVLIFGHNLPGVGLVGILVMVFLLGLIATRVGGAAITRAVDTVMFRAPILHWVYRPTRQAIEAVQGLGKTPFKRVVIVEFPRPGMDAVAFVTGKPVDVRGEKRVPVFIPHAPNPMTGFTLLLCPKDIIDTDLTVEEAMRMVVSAGLLSPETVKQPAAS